MLVETEQMIPIARLQNELPQTVCHLNDSGEAVYIVHNNNMEAVLVPYREYAYLKQLEDMVERCEVKDMLDNRLKHYNALNNVSWSDIKSEL